MKPAEAGAILLPDDQRNSLKRLKLKSVSKCSGASPRNANLYLSATVSTKRQKPNLKKHYFIDPSSILGQSMWKNLTFPF
jgi:hypothetical protein